MGSGLYKYDAVFNRDREVKGMMFEYVLVVYMTMNKPEYVGHFTSCAASSEYAEKHYPNAEYTSCLHEDYINLPEGLIKKEIK